jgi:hypothetical protein
VQADDAREEREAFVRLRRQQLDMAEMRDVMKPWLGAGQFVAPILIQDATRCRIAPSPGRKIDTT